jgi:uncharacterized repeat protein (TIGR02543 family)
MRFGKIYGKTASRMSVRLLDIVIILGIAAMAILIPYLSANGGFTVTFDSLGGTEVASQRLRYGDAIEMPPTPTREDYTFEGWTYDKDGKRAVDFSTATADKSATLYAQWREIE